jgi:hypothetical protein
MLAAMVVVTVRVMDTGSRKGRSTFRPHLFTLGRLRWWCGLHRFISAVAGAAVGALGAAATTVVIAKNQVRGAQRPRKNSESSSRMLSWRQVGRPWLHWSERSVTSI